MRWFLGENTSVCVCVCACIGRVTSGDPGLGRWRWVEDVDLNPFRCFGMASKVGDAGNCIILKLVGLLGVYYVWSSRTAKKFEYIPVL